MLEKSETGKKRKKKQSEIKLLTSTIQMSLDPPLTWTLIAVHKKGGGGLAAPPPHPQNHESPEYILFSPVRFK